MGTTCVTARPFPSIGSPSIDPELMKQIEEIVGQSIVTIPLNYTAERDRILEEMRKAAPEPYENLLHADYPDKNEGNVNALAAQNVTSDEVKKQVSDKVNEQIKPTIDDKTKDMNPMAQAALQKAVEKAVEESVNKAFDKAIEEINNKNTKQKEKV